tara:strand:+ start:184 stop:465 length:282 start_codon:yes stop_codon:yes gene_type:complete
MLSLGEVNQKISKLKSWHLEGNSISKEFHFRDFKGSIYFVNKVTEIAEKMEHHPDILITYNKVRLILSTKALSGLSGKDFEVAEAIDNLNEVT